MPYLSLLSLPRKRRALAAAVAASVAAIGIAPAMAEDNSPAPFLQLFESTWKNMENRTADIFATGYGGIWTPPPGRADSGDQSVGYDVYDRFDLGYAGRSTLYGTKTGLQAGIGELHKAGSAVYIDMIWNHAGFTSASSVDGQGHSFLAAGGYPGLGIQFQNTNPNGPMYTPNINDPNGDFHGANETGDWNMRLAGLIDIAQEKNWQLIRHPVAANAQNIPAGTVAAYGRLANQVDPNNAQYYPDRDLGGTSYFNPRTNQNVTLYRYNSANPLAGDAVAENATGYLMRYSQWMVQQIGVDGFRIDAAKNMPPWVLDYYDQAVFNASNRVLLDGTRRPVFGFSEVYDSNKALLQSYIRKDLGQIPANQIAGNRDALDFPLYWAMNQNLTSNGLTNNWNNVKNASQDSQDDGLANNGSQGVSFVQAHDSGLPAPYLQNVAYAYTLMRPGNSLVYMNAKEFGNNRPFPLDGRGDALGGFYGDAIKTLVDIRNTHGRGNYADRTPAANNKELLIYERQNSALVLLNNRLDNGYDQLTVTTAFAPGTPLLELTGNAANITVDPNNDLAEVVIVNGDGTANIRVPRNKNANGVEHDKGYLIYGPSGPQGSLSFTNVAQTIAGGTATAGNNGTVRLSSIKVITTDSFNVTLQTNKVNLLGSIRDHDADGDNAILSIDKEYDLNGNGTVDFRTPGDYKYGFDDFVTVKTPGYSSGDNNGTYTQAIDTTQLSEGYHYVTARAFRHRDSGPAIFNDFKQTIYVDRLKPVSAVTTFLPWDQSQTQNRDVTVQSVDQTASKVQVLIDQPANKTDAQILAMVGTNSFVATQTDRDLFKYGFFGVNSGNHVFTIVTREISGNYNIQRIAGNLVTTSLGAGLGDLNADGQYASGDVTGTSYGMEAMIMPNGQGQTNTQFNAAADMNGDGLMDSRDLYLQRDRFVTIGAPAGAINAAKNAVLRRGDVNGNFFSNANVADIDFLYANFGNTGWGFDLDVDGWPSPNGADQQDMDVMIRTIFQTDYGDTNLDRKIDGSDYATVDSNFNQQVIVGNIGGWANGDFDGNGKIDGADYALIDIAFNLQGSGSMGGNFRALRWLSGEDRSMDGMDTPDMQRVIGHYQLLGESYALGFINFVPEPGSAGLLLAGLCGIMMRRCRNRGSDHLAR